MELSTNTKIVFTSCMRYEAFQEQPIWEYIDTEINPDYLLLMGDQIYMDFGVRFIGKEPNGSPEFLSYKDFRETMDKKYERQWGVKGFKELFHRLSQDNRVFGVWDDHDFAWNNAKGIGQRAVSNEKKLASKRLFNKWMYGEESDNEIYKYVDLPMARLILLDCRFYSTKENQKDATLLGPKQMEFLQEALNHDKEFTLVVSGVSMTQVPDLFSFTSKRLLNRKEKWENYKDEFNRIKTLFSQNENKIIYLAGDIHRNVYQAHQWGPNTVHEVISSGAAIDHAGLRGFIDGRQNFGVLHCLDDRIRIDLFAKQRRKSFEIAKESWECLN